MKLIDIQTGLVVDNSIVARQVFKQLAITAVVGITWASVMKLIGDALLKDRTQLDALQATNAHHNAHFPK